jgi:N-acetylglucosaminyl-diphospho-decaprenol L-rhamnosyltransferase
MAVDLAVVIVTWNNRNIVLDALRSIFDDLAGSRLSATIYVVDSASSDGTVEVIQLAFPQVKVIASAQNLGFAGGNNLALNHMGFGSSDSDSLPKAVYLINPDTITQLGATQTLFDVLFSDERIGLVGASLSYEDGGFQHGAFMFPGLRQLWVEFFPTPGRLINAPFNGRYPQERYASQQPFEVDFVLGATMMLKREVIELTTGFDEQFFMYCEEVDWAWRIHDAGWKVYCVPSAHVTHLSGKSASQIRVQSLLYLWKSRLLLFDKHYSPIKRFLARKMVAYGMTFKRRQLSAVGGLTKKDRAALSDAYNTIREMASQ